ncbi:hypothetical protein K504DRAFT_486708 [Pleomassaria siparia CBS 279.74]|uniref:Uncharacterized protein n=1 Tax=Pleomassaria siparia CBS 279.74 TaxID=1314801 RepID=A0A6G1KRG6_9PLEO|nr:hypothetical protein K504DRAFT_486708 [Pleomassaria siparia CBS 279.74]
MDASPSSILTSYDSDDAEHDGQPDDLIILENRPMTTIEDAIQDETQEDGWEEDEREWEREEVIEPVVLTSGAINPLVTSRITHVSLLPDYPDTSLVGYTYCVMVDRNGAHLNQVLQEALRFQYCRRLKCPSTTTTSPFLGGRVIRYRYRCTGIKCCEHLHNTLKTHSHTRVTQETWQELKHARQGIGRTDINKASQASDSLYLTVTRRFRSGISCAQQSPQCAPVLRQSDSGAQPWYIGCASWTQQSTQYYKTHFFRSVGNKYNIARLQKLFQDGLEEVEQQVEFCRTVESTTSRMKKCTVNHLQGPGQLVHQACEAEFDILIPCNLEETPYYLFTSHGVHTHPPLSPHNTPAELREEVIKLIYRMHDPSLTAAKFLCGPFLEELCRKHRTSHFAELYTMLENLGWIERQVYRTNLIFPRDQDFAGVEFEWHKQKKDPSKAYIQHIQSDSLETFIICFFREQAQLFATQETFQIDLSLKPIGKNSFREMVFATFHKGHGKVVTLARVFTNIDQTRVYTSCFETFFRLLSESVQKQIGWKHLHNEGFVGITVNMDGKQITGLGEYLSSIDPLRREWQWQLKNIVVLCQTSFLRSITTAAGSKQNQYSVHHRMRALLTCQSLDDYMELCDKLIVHELPAIQQWARHKKDAVVAAGLNKHCSLMAADDWDAVSKTSSAVEQSADNPCRNSLRLLQAIQTAHMLDMRDMNQFQSREILTMRYMNHSASDKHHQKRILDAQEEEQLSDDESDDDIIFRATSSGFVPASSVPRRRRSSTRGNSRATSQPRRSSSARDLRGTSPASSNDRAKRQAPNNNTDLQHRRLLVELRAREAEVKRMELENTRLEMDIEERRRALGYVPNAL